MRFTEFFDSTTCFTDEILGDGQNDAEVRRIEEAWEARERLHALFSREAVCEVQARGKSREPVKVNADHHVHGPFRHNRLQARHVFKNVVS